MSNPAPSSAPSLGQVPRTAEPPGEWRETTPIVRRRIYGIQPALFVGMCLLAIVSLVTVILIFTGDFESQAERVVWTVLVFLGFTGFLALDLNLSRRDSTPLVLGVAGNTYLLGALMLVIWMRNLSSDYSPYYQDYDDGWLLGIIVMMFLVVRVAVAAAWGLIVCGRRSGNAFGRGTGLAAASLVGLAGFLLTFHHVMYVFDLEPSEFYWRSTVAVIVVTALAASVTVLLFWNRRNLEWEEAVAKGHQPSTRQERSIMEPQLPARSHRQESAHQREPAQKLAAQFQVDSVQYHPQPEQAMLPWPRFPDGTPYPAGNDGQPVFPPNQ